MNRRIGVEIEEVIEGEKVTFYSIKYDNNTENEFVNFLKNFSAIEYKDHVDVMLSAIERIGQDGALERHFRYAGKKRDSVFEMPSHLDRIPLRLYCIRINEKIVIIGNGGLKNTRTYNEDPLLNDIVTRLQEVDSVIKFFRTQNWITIDEHKLEGRLKFYIQEKDQNEV